MKKITILICLLSISFSFSQSKDQLVDYYNTLKSQGFTDIQIKNLAEQNGYDVNNLSTTTKNTINKIPQTAEIKQEAETNYNNYSSENIVPDEEKVPHEIFGSRYFESLDFDFTPQINIATPSSYQLGPSDGLSISLWGASEVNYRLDLDRSGKILIEGVGPIYLSGYTLVGAKSKIKKALSNNYSGLYSEDPNKKINIDVTLNNTRSVFVSIIGQVKAPGLYTLNGMSSPIHALYAAGGITENGSYRNVEVLRNGKTVSKIDLYDYFVNGNLPLLFLKDQDVIKVPYYNNRTLLEGEVKFSGYFELNAEESIDDLINYSGGLSPVARNDQYLISRIDGVRYKTINTSELNTPLKSGDKVYVYPIARQEDQSVTIQGEVLTPGRYSVAGLETIGDLISISNGFTKDAYLDFAALFRQQNDNTPQMISVGLNSEKFDLNLKEFLKERDSLVVYNKNQFLPFEKIKVLGEVTNPSQYNFYNHMSIQDALSLASGIKIPKERLKIVVQSKQNLDYFTRIELEQFTSKDLSTIILRPDDVITVIEKNKNQPISINLIGEFKNQGTYIQSKKSNLIKDVIKQAGGFTEFADLNSLHIKRRRIKENDGLIEDYLLDGIQELDEKPQFLYIPISSVDDSYFFEDGDQLYVQKKSDDIMLNGEVLIPSVVKFKSTSLRYYLSKSGISSNGSKKNTYVIYPNKDVFSTKRFLFFKFYPKITPGSEIVVGKKPERAKLTTQEVLGISSGLSTLVIVLSTLLSNQ